MPPLDTSRFYRYDEMTDYLRAVVEEHPKLASLESIGKSHEGRDIWVVTLTNFNTGAASEKPGFWVDANIHAGEVTGSTAALHLIDRLVGGYGGDPEVARLLDRSAFYVAPRLSPDGAELYLTTPEMLRSSTRPYPYGDERPGLYPQDLDGDGAIRSMRVRDPKGAWKASEKDPRVTRRREFFDEGGTYYHLYTEGLVREYDGYTLKSAPPRYGLDLNRSFPYEWAPEGTQRGAGPHPLSEPETRAVAEFFASHKNLNGAHTYHTQSGVLLRPYDDKPDDALPTHDLTVYGFLGRRGTELTGWPAVSVFHNFRYDPKETLHGGFDTWVYDHHGVYSYTVELWDPVGSAGIGEPKEHGVRARDFIGWFRDHPEEDDLAIMRFHDEHNLGLFQDWTGFEHPQLGPVELGGLHPKFYWQNAPAKFLPEVVSRTVSFTLAHAGASPRLAVKLLEARPAAEGVYRIVLVLENTGFLPTYTSSKAAERKAVEPIRVTLELPEGAELVSGERTIEAGQLEGRSNKAGAFGAAPVGDQERKLEWVVRAPAGATVSVTAVAPRAGTARASVTV